MVVLNGRDIILTGVPRAGTTLACQLIHQCDGSVALFEPMDMTALHYGDRQAAIAGVQRFFVDARKQLLAEGTAPSMQVDGGIPDNSFASAMDTSGHRRLLASPGLIRVEPKPQAGFTLVVKHNASFTALLPELAAKGHGALPPPGHGDAR